VVQPYPLPNFVVPNVAFADPYAHLSQPQQSVAIIGGYAARNMQNIAAIQTNANQINEGNANIAYELGRLHLAPPGQFSKGTTTKTTISTTDRRLEKGGALVNLSFSFF
jgi:hypothetical protein